MNPSYLKVECIAYALYARFSRIWRSRTFLFGLGSMVGIPNVGKKILPQADNFSHSNILVLRPDALGDVILTIPFLRELKKRLPQARVTLAVAKPWKGLVDFLKIVDETVEFPLNADRWRASSNVFRALMFGMRTLKKRKFDLVLCPRWDADFHDAHLVAFFSYAPQRITFFEKASLWKAESNRGRDSFYTHVIPDAGIRHEAARSLYFLEAIGLGSFPGGCESDLISIADKVAPADLELDPSWTGDKLIGVFPGVQDPDRQWAVDNFIEAAKMILKRRQVRFLVLGTEKESVQCARFCQGLAGFALNCSDKTSLPQLARLLLQCSLVISCNSGGAHLAGALDVPVAVIFNYAFRVDPDNALSPERFRPLGKNVAVLEPPAWAHAAHFQESLSVSVTPGQVAEAASRLLDQKAGQLH